MSLQEVHATLDASEIPYGDVYEPYSDGELYRVLVNLDYAHTVFDGVAYATDLPVSASRKVWLSIDFDSDKNVVDIH